MENYYSTFTTDEISFLEYNFSDLLPDRFVLYYYIENGEEG